MRKQLLVIALGMFTAFTFAQKKELKAASKAIKNQDFDAAISAIASAEGLIANADAKTKSNFYFLQGQAFGGKKDYEKAAKAYNDLFAFEEQTGKKRYSDKALPMLNVLKNEVNAKAFKLHEAKNYKESSKAFYLRYTLDKKDTMFLSNAAQLALQGNDYDTSFKHYNTLTDLGYTGIKDLFEATEKKTGKKATFNSKEEMNLMVKSGQYTGPKTTKSPSKKTDILNSLVAILSKQKKYDKAVALIKKIRVGDPDNLELLLVEAFLYNDLKQPKKFEALMKEATAKDPNNPDLYYNIGIVNYNEKNVEQSIKYFSKAVELKPDYPKGNWMLANSLFLNDTDLVSKMNALPPSDFKNYEKLEKERKSLFTKILPILDKADKAGRTSGTVRLLMFLYEQLEMDDKATEFRNLLKTIE